MRITKAVLQQQVAGLRRELEDAMADQSHYDMLAAELIHTKTELANLKDLYTRVRVAIAGGTGQEPWDIFDKIKRINSAADYRQRRAEYWKDQWRQESRAHTNALLKLNETWVDRLAEWASGRMQALRWWWARNKEVTLAWIFVLASMVVWFMIGRASVQ